MNRTVQSFLAGIILGVIICYLSYGKVISYFEKRQAENSRKQSDLAKKRNIETINERYKADTTWDRNMHFTSQYQDFFRNHHDPIYLRGTILDVSTRNDVFVLSVSNGDALLRQKIFELAMSREQYERVKKTFLEKPPDETSLFFGLAIGAIATIDTVSNASFELKLKGDETSSSSRIEIETSPFTILTGTLIDFAEEDPIGLFMQSMSSLLEQKAGD